MKRLFIPLLSIFIVGSSCDDSTNGNQEKQKIRFNEAETVAAIDSQMTMKIGDASELFSYADMVDVRDKSVPAFEKIQHDALAAIPTVPNCVYVSQNVEISRGKAILTSFAYLDSSMRIIEQYARDTATGEFKIYIGAPVPTLETSGCPNGYTPIKICDSGIFFGACYGSALTSYLGANLENAGCARIMVTQALGGVWICGKTC